MEGLIVDPPQQLIKVAGVRVRIAEIDINSRFVIDRQVGLALRVPLGNHSNELVLSGPVVYLRRNNLRLGAYATFPSICLIDISAIGAGEGNRTLVVSLGSSCSTIELHPQIATGRTFDSDQASQNSAL